MFFSEVVVSNFTEAVVKFATIRESLTSLLVVNSFHAVVLNFILSDTVSAPVLGCLVYVVVSLGIVVVVLLQSLTDSI